MIKYLVRTAILGILIFSSSIISAYAAEDNSESMQPKKNISFSEDGDVVLEISPDNEYEFKSENGKTKFYDINGNQVSCEWINSKGTWYYFDKNGDMCIGWSKIKDNWYYFLEDGKMSTGWICYNNNWYFMGVDGAMQKSKTMFIEGKEYTFDESGKLI